MTQRLLAFTLVAGACAPRQSALPDSASVTPAKVADRPGYTEGLAFDANGVAFVSAGRNPSASHAVYRLPTGRVPDKWLDLRIPNGHKVLAEGTHVVAGEGTIVHRGGVLLSQWHHRTADGRVLYVDDSCDGRLYRLPIFGPGKLGSAEGIAVVPDSTEAGLDGITLDQDGRLYVAHNGVGGVEVFDSTGRPLGHYAAGNLLASNVAFGGRDLGDLYVTGSAGDKMGPGALFRLRLGVRGPGSMAVPAAGPVSR